MPRPNLLVIMSDQHNPHIMGCAGDPAEPLVFTGI